MKKISFLPFLAMAVFVSQAQAAYAPCENPYAGFCLYDSGDCWELNKGPTDAANCETVYNSCVADGWLFTGTPSTGEGTLCAGGTFSGQGKTNTPPTELPGEAVGCCNWNRAGCFTIFTQEAKEDCLSSTDHEFYATCPNDAQGTCVGSPIEPSSSSGGEPNPIISYSSVPITGLKVDHFARSLQIASGKDATVSLFDMHGKQVFSQKVLGGGKTTISLESQRQGVYYAVVQSGSQKQTVKVVLK